MGGLILVSAGVIDNFHANQVVTTVVHGHQTITGGPVASQEVIKAAGNNGGSELLARMRAVTRRGAAEVSEPQVSLGDTIIDRETSGSTWPSSGASAAAQDRRAARRNAEPLLSS